MIGSHPNESPEYRKLREELLAAEVALRDQRERVAELRRSLPRDTEVPDETFARIRDGREEPVKLSELFEEPSRPLVLMHFMFGKAQDRPCPMCTSWADGYDGVVPHLRQRVNFAVLAAADAGAFEAYGRERGWRHLPLVSAADSGLKRSLGFEDESGAQHPGVSVFLRRSDDTPIHTYSVSAWLGEAGFRGMDLLNPLWHFLDLTPEGRGDFMPSKTY
jgi:predicted dithiol-disulfide oxidoreductase (DUF899 family)